jgi:beta-galactosidase/beta-glucuronidase/DNA-binding CsgD family transcriptional regulator
LWSPDSPFLYTLKVTLKSGGKVVDKVDSYAAMRKYSTRRDADGIVRLELNNEALFQFGPLDQGWWPDGLYTAPTDEALLYDVQKTKDFGFNMIRKHIKVEPARWYTHCDRLGIIVWQDMPSGDRNPEWQNRRYFDGTELKRSTESESYYHKEWKEIMDCLYSYPCIGTWVPFNEAWGQFKTVEIAEWTKQYDPTRLVNPASGGNHYTCGDMLDLHNYPQPEMYLYDAQRATVLGEYGGIGLVLKDHIRELQRTLEESHASLEENRLLHEELAYYLQQEQQMREKEQSLRNREQLLLSENSLKAVELLNRMKNKPAFMPVSSEEDWQVLIDFMDILYDGYSQTIRKIKGLTGRDRELCYLMRLGFTTGQMAIFYGISPGSVTKAKFRIQKKMEAELPSASCREAASCG